MVDDYVLHKVFGKYKKIKGIKKIDDIKIFIATDDKLPDDFTLKNTVAVKMVVNTIIHLEEINK